MLARLRGIAMHDQIGQQRLQAKLMHNVQWLLMLEEAKSAQELNPEKLHRWL
jgi:hypothetical protein